MTQAEQPEQWAVELARHLRNAPSTLSLALALQRAFTERTADLVADNAKLREALKRGHELLASVAQEAAVELVAALAQQDTTDEK